MKQLQASLGKWPITVTTPQLKSKAIFPHTQYSNKWLKKYKQGTLNMDVCLSTHQTHPEL